MHSCHDPEMAIIKLRSPGGICGRLQCVPSRAVSWQWRAAAAALTAAGAAAVAAVYPNG